MKKDADDDVRCYYYDVSYGVLGFYARATVDGGGARRRGAARASP